jgi:hypothetical protein
MDHAVTGKPVVGRGVDLGDGVGPVADIPAAEVLGDRPGHRRVDRGVFGLHGRVVAL